MNMIQAEFGVIPSIVKKENREEYIKSLAAFQEEGNIIDRAEAKKKDFSVLSEVLDWGTKIRRISFRRYMRLYTASL